MTTHAASYCTVIAAVETVTGIETLAPVVVLAVIAHVPAATGETLSVASPPEFETTAAVAIVPVNGEHESLSTKTPA